MGGDRNKGKNEFIAFAFTQMYLYNVTMPYFAGKPALAPAVSMHAFASSQSTLGNMRSPAAVPGIRELETER
jgi:hypothetical protein